jgi:hypothetical protein
MKTFNIPFTKGAKGLLWLPSEGIHIATQELRGKIYRGALGKTEDLGVLSRKLVTTEGVNWIRNTMGGVYYLYNISFVVGTNANSNPEGIANTLAEVNATAITGFDFSRNILQDEGLDTGHVVPTKTTGVKTLALEANFDFYNMANQSVKECSMCFAGVYPGGLTPMAVFDRSVFSAQNVTASDKLKFTYTLVFQDGG